MPQSARTRVQQGSLTHTHMHTRTLEHEHTRTHTNSVALLNPNRVILNTNNPPQESVHFNDGDHAASRQPPRKRVRTWPSQ